MIVFDRYVREWRLQVDGEPVHTQFSSLLPVLFDGNPAMLKLLKHDEERTGSEVLAWWNGHGTVRVLDQDGDCLLLERAVGKRSLVDMARHGEDDAATTILCQSAMRLHRNTGPEPAPVVPTLWQWFEPLLTSPLARTGELREAASLARQLLATQRDEVVLHGDLHHDNVLDGSSRGWLAIDPKGLYGERTFDYANILRNPLNHFGADRDRLAQRIGVIAEVAEIDPGRMLAWTAAFCGLSAVWILEEVVISDVDGEEASSDLAILQRILSMMGQ